MTSFNETFCSSCGHRHNDCLCHTESGGLADPTTMYRCRECNTLWRQFATGAWCLVDSKQKPQKCCDNSPNFLSNLDPVNGDQGVAAIPDHPSEVLSQERIKIVLDCLREMSRECTRNWNPLGNDDGIKGIENLGRRHCLEDAILLIQQRDLAAAVALEKAIKAIPTSIAADCAITQDFSEGLSHAIDVIRSSIPASAQTVLEDAELWRLWSKLICALQEHNFPHQHTFSYLREAMRDAAIAKEKDRG